jgi:hypothetical protein
VPTIGSQALLRVLPNTQYDLGAVTDATVEIPLAQHIDVLGYEHAALQVRIRSGSFPSGSSLRINLADDGYNPEDPTASFLQKVVGGEEMGTLEITDQTVFPFYQSVSTSIPGTFGRLMAITASFAGGPEGGPSVVMSMDLVLTGGSVGTAIRQPATYLGYAHEPLEADEAFEQFTFDQPQPGLVDRLITAIRDVFQTARLPPGYPRFGNVNVAIRGDREGPAAPREGDE